MSTATALLAVGGLLLAYAIGYGVGRMVWRQHCAVELEGIRAELEDAAGERDAAAAHWARWSVAEHARRRRSWM